MPRKNGHKTNLEQLLNDVKAVVRDGQEWLRIGATELRERTRVRAQSADQLVRGNPYRAVGVALAIGLVAGLLIGRPSRSEPEGEIEN